MATIRNTIHVGDKPPVKAIKEVREAENRPIIYDDDSPRISDEEYAQMAAIARKQREDEELNCSLNNP